MKIGKLMKRIVRSTWRAAKQSWKRDKRALDDISKVLANWSEVKVPGPPMKGKPIANRYRVKAHTRRDGTRVKAHWRVK